jgi:hypothetical protein
MEKKKTYDEIINWLSNSKIRNQNGAVYSWLNPQKEGYIYPEIIGYYIKLFSYLYSIEKEEKFKELAVSSADYLCSILSKNGSVSRENIEYVFDTGICLSGMLSLNKVNLLKESYKQPLRAMAQFIKNSLSRKVVSFKDGEPLIDETRWSLSYGSLIIKTAISLVEYGKYSNDPEYSIFAENIVDELLAKTFKDDHFSINEFKDWTYTHSHCYATEGFCFLYKNGYKKYENIIQKSANWLSKVQNDDGSTYNWHYNENAHREKNADEIAQTVRIWLFADKVKYSENINKAISFLKTLQSPEGGLYYNPNSKDVNSWVSMFTLQALYWDINNCVDFDWIV